MYDFIINATFGPTSNVGTLLILSFMASIPDHLSGEYPDD